MAFPVCEPLLIKQPGTCCPLCFVSKRNWLCMSLLYIYHSIMCTWLSTAGPVVCECQCNRLEEITGPNVSVWSVAHVQRAPSTVPEATQLFSNTCHQQKIVLHSSGLSKQPKGLKQYQKYNDFIYSLNTRQGVLPLSLIPGAYEVE